MESTNNFTPTGKPMGGLLKSSAIIFMLSASLISMEVIWTRVFSAEYFYTFAFLVLSLSILGLGLGALSIRLFPKLKNPKSYPLTLIITSVLMVVSPLLVLKMDIDFTQLFSSGYMALKVLATVILLSSSFFTGGIVLSSYFSRSHEKLQALYTADLIGAGFGIVMSVLLMNIFQTHMALFIIAIPVLISALMLSKGLHKIWSGALIIAVFALLPFSKDLLKRDKPERVPVIFEHWNAMAKIKIQKYDDQYWNINIDNAANTPVIGFDGNFNRPDSLKIPFRRPVTNLIHRFDSCVFLSLGAGGGGDVLHALQENATEVHAVEVNPYINKMMTDGFLKDFSGNLFNDSRVKVVTEDARTYIRRFDNKFDIIYSLSSNTFSALASGSFALAENYLFTEEAFVDYYNALSENGFLFMEHQFYVPRMISEVLAALEKKGIKNPKDHLAVYNFPTLRRKIIIMGKQPLTDDIRQNAIFPLTAEYYPYIHLLYPAADSLKNNLVNRIVENGWKSVQSESPIDLSPCTDNRPFVAQLGMMKNYSSEKLKKVLPYEFMGFPISKLLIIIILIIIGAVIIPLNIIPYFKKGPKLPAKGFLYFFLIGFAYMVVEVILIQKYTLVIGASSYTLMSILFVLLLSSGIGSRFAHKFNNSTPFMLIAMWVVADIAFFPFFGDMLASSSLFTRIACSLLWIMPVGFFMGMPFVKGGKKVGELIDWGFAVNGAASVVGSVLVLVLAFNYGFNIAIFAGVVAYFIAMLLIKGKKEWL